jgi:hypothetical protein
MQSRSAALVVVSLGLLGLLLTTAGCASSSSSTSPVAPTIVSHKKSAGGAYVIGGEVTGLRGIGLTLKSSRGHEVHIKNDGAFIFNESVEDKSDYVVTIEREPIAPLQSCAIERGAKGKVAGRDAMEISIRCTTSSFEAPPVIPASSSPSSSSVALLEAVR